MISFDYENTKGDHMASEKTAVVLDLDFLKKKLVDRVMPGILKPVKKQKLT